MDLLTVVRRQGFRVAHHLLRIWWFVRRPTVRGVKCVLIDGDRMLLVRHTYGHRGWDLPGGGVRRDEPAVETARREMLEELGLAIDDWTHLGEFRSAAYHRHDSLNFFCTRVSAPQLQLDRAELADASWFTREEIPPRASKYVSWALGLLLPLDGSGRLAGDVQHDAANRPDLVDHP
jgi:8-oxo-dGTP pyrophosphatase MutT (NUDIX family)